MKNERLPGIAIPFFTQEQWANARSVMEDGHTFHDSYAEFVQRVSSVEKKLRGQGNVTVRVNIEPEAFVQWCRGSGRKVDAESRSQYAAMKAAQTDSSREN